MSIGTVIRAARKKRGLSQQDLAKKLGVSKPAVSKWENDEALPERKRMALLAEATGVPIGHLTALAAGDRGVDQTTPMENPVAPAETEAVRAPDAPLPPLRSEMPKDVPVYGTVVGGTGQGSLLDFELNGTIVDYARRPPRIAGRADVFAAYVSGGSMAPWREPGQLIYVEAVKPPRAMDYVLVEMKPHDGHSVRPALVKRLLAITPTKVRLRQFDPPKDFEIERRMVLRVLRVMDWDELMGV